MALVNQVNPAPHQLLRCIHCNNEIPTHSPLQDFCCRGCQYVYQLINECGLERFHELKSIKLAPLLNYFTRRSDYSWIKTHRDKNSGRMILNIEGVQCTACIWLIQKLSKRYNVLASVNSVFARLTVEFNPHDSTLENFLREIDKFGYRTSPVLKETKSQSDKFLLRLGICSAIAMNSMIFSIAFYAGLGDNQPLLYTLFRHASFLLALAAVLIGGSYFIGRAYHALRSKVLSFDLPIAVGIVITFVGSTWAYIYELVDSTYFDTLCVFITLMLLGRFLQNRVVEKNRASLLEEMPLTQLKIARIGHGIADIPVAEIKKADQLIIPSGGLIPVDSRLIEHTTIEVRLDWSSGESTPKVITTGESVTAGAKLITNQAVKVEAEQDFDDSALVPLLFTTGNKEGVPVLWQKLSKWYAVGVLSIALFGFLYWSLYDLKKALEVAVAVVVVTCPCSIGIAVPLARALALKVLAKSGVFQRDVHLLEKLQRIKKIFLDKTGTITLAELQVVNPEIYDHLSERDLTVLFNAASRSRHPASQAIYQSLLRRKIAAQDVEVREEPGIGLHITYHRSAYFLGHQVGANQDTDDASRFYTVEFSRNKKRLALIHLHEVILDGAKRAVDELQAGGMAVFQVSGDKNARVEAMAKYLNIPENNSYGECSPAEKAKIVAQLDDQDTLYLGDGLNDKTAFQHAYLTGSPVWDNSSLAAGSSFHFLSTNLRWLSTMFATTKRLQNNIHFNLAFAALYNSIALTLALLGIIGPLICAIIMPLSSLCVISVTAYHMKGNMI